MADLLGVDDEICTHYLTDTCSVQATLAGENPCLLALSIVFAGVFYIY